MDAPALSAQPLPVEQVRAGQLRAEPGTAQPPDRLAVQVVGLGAGAEQRPAAGLEAECGIVAAALRDLGELLEGIAGQPGLPAVRGRLDQLG